MSTKILIVEDDADFAASLDLALDLIGFSAVIAGSAEEALEVVNSLQDGEIKIGFFDIKLPQDDGIACYEKIRLQYPDFIGVVMTGFRDEKILDRARKSGAVDILLKPFRMAHFMDLVKKYSTRETQ